MSRSVAEQSAILSSQQAVALVTGRLFGVPNAMIEAAGERRSSGDWRGSCRAAGFDVRLEPDRLRRRYGGAVVQDLLDDLQHLAADLLRWHLPRKAHGPGRLRTDLRIPLAEYPVEPGSDRLQLIAGTTRSAAAAAS